GPEPGGLPAVREPPAGIDAIDEEHRSLLPTVAPHTHRRRWPTAEARYATPGPASRRERALGHLQHDEAARRADVARPARRSRHLVGQARRHGGDRGSGGRREIRASAPPRRTET